MADIQVLSKDGKSAGSIKVSEKIAAAGVKPVSTHRAVLAEEANRRQGTQSALTRSEIRGGGRKPYKQKKTGNARQGSTRSPQYTHGAMAMAVKPRDYTKKINKKERRAAILGAFASQLEAGNIVIVDSIAFLEPKTKQALQMLVALGLAETKRVLVVLPQYDEITYKSFRNLPNVEVRTAPSNAEGGKASPFSTRDVLVAHKIVVAQDALARIEEVWAK